MESIKTAPRLHPLMAAAAVSVVIVSLAGTAAITGLLPNSRATVAPAQSALPPAAQLSALTPAPVPMVPAAPV
ncbi:MAG: surface antigen family protein, partial [Massilia sp.]|nr:surface antigen family protein [Massilia sp.]